MMPWLIAAAAVLVIVAGASNLEASSGSGGGSIQEMIRGTAEANGISPAVMLALCRKESSFDPSAVNPSDPSYGLFQIQPFWLREFGYVADSRQLMDPEFNADVACRIVGYFQGKGFRFPEQADIYNVGETLWRKGIRNVAYRDAVNGYYRSYV